MNKILAVLCTLTVLLSLTACGNNAETVQNESNANRYTQNEQITKSETNSTSNTVSETAESNVTTSDSTTPDKSVESAAPAETPQQNTPDLTEQASATEPPATSETKPQTEAKPATQTETKPETQTEPPVAVEEPNMLKVEIIAGSKTFFATLYDNEAAKTLTDMLPLTLDMSELNGNEKYYYLDTGLPTNASRPSGIKAGDIMLYGNSCLVLFYESFSTSYSYTPIGYIDDPSGLAAALGSGNVQVTFKK